eukprot:6272930-Karenia_brevis.AAC.1
MGHSGDTDGSAGSLGRRHGRAQASGSCPHGGGRLARGPHHLLAHPAAEPPHEAAGAAHARPHHCRRSPQGQWRLSRRRLPLPGALPQRVRAGTHGHPRERRRHHGEG